MNLESNRDYLMSSTGWTKDDGLHGHPLFRAQFTAGVSIHPEANIYRGEFERLGKTALSMMDSDSPEEFEWPEVIEELLWEDRMTPQQIIRGLSQTRPICLQIQCCPELDRLFWECRASLAAGNFYAAVCAARGCLELAVTDVAATLKLIDPPDGSKDYAKRFPIMHRINLVAPKDCDDWTTLREIYTYASEVIHCGEIPNRTGAMLVIRDLCSSIESVYSAYEKRIASEAIGEI